MNNLASTSFFTYFLEYISRERNNESKGLIFLNAFIKSKLDLSCLSSSLGCCSSVVNYSDICFLQVCLVMEYAEGGSLYNGECH